MDVVCNVPKLEQEMYIRGSRIYVLLFFKCGDAENTNFFNVKEEKLGSFFYKKKVKTFMSQCFNI